MPVCPPFPSPEPAEPPQQANNNKFPIELVFRFRGRLSPEKTTGLFGGPQTTGWHVEVTPVRLTPPRPVIFFSSARASGRPGSPWASPLFFPLPLDFDKFSIKAALGIFNKTPISHVRSCARSLLKICPPSPSLLNFCQTQPQS